MKNVLKYFGALLFVGLVLAKVSAFHVYEHHDTLSGQDTHCEFCFLAIENQQADVLLDPVEVIVEDPGLPEYKGDTNPYELQLHNGPLKTALFSRPPPSLLI